MPEARRAFGDSVVDVLTTVPGLGVDRLERRRILAGIAVGRQYSRLPEIGVDSFYPNRVGRIDLTPRQPGFAAEYLGLEIADHRIASWYSRCRGCARPKEPAD